MRLDVRDAWRCVTGQARPFGDSIDLVGIAATPRVVSQHHAPSQPRPRARLECMDLSPDAEEPRCRTRFLPPAAQF